MRLFRNSTFYDANFLKGEIRKLSGVRAKGKSTKNQSEDILSNYQIPVNPQQFMDRVIKEIRHIMNRVIIDGIVYDRLEGVQYEMPHERLIKTAWCIAGMNSTQESIPYCITQLQKCATCSTDERLFSPCLYQGDAHTGDTFDRL